MRATGWRISFNLFNYTFLCLLAVLCLLPLVHVLAVSFSANHAASAGIVKLWPVDFTTTSYSYVLGKQEFVRSLLVSVKRVILGTIVNMLMTVLLAYPLSKESATFKSRTVYVWILVITILFSGGLIPYYMVIKSVGLLDSIWALVLPGAVPVFNVILLLNFFRNIPKEMEEAAFIDGAGHWKLLWSIFLPVSKPAIATIFLFTVVGHWNSWFDGILYMNSPEKYPLQTYLSTLVNSLNKISITVDDLSLLQNLSDKTLRTAQIFLGALPIMLVYPFLQKHFTKGITIGSVKG